LSLPFVLSLLFSCLIADGGLALEQAVPFDPPLFRKFFATLASAPSASSPPPSRGLYPASSQGMFLPLASARQTSCFFGDARRRQRLFFSSSCKGMKTLIFSSTSPFFAFFRLFGKLGLIFFFCKSPVGVEASPENRTSPVTPVPVSASLFLTSSRGSKRRTFSVFLFWPKFGSSTVHRRRCSAWFPSK